MLAPKKGADGVDADVASMEWAEATHDPCQPAYASRVQARIANYRAIKTLRETATRARDGAKKFLPMQGKSYGARARFRFGTGARIVPVADCDSIRLLARRNARPASRPRASVSTRPASMSSCAAFIVGDRGAGGPPPDSSRSCGNLSASPDDASAPRNDLFETALRARIDCFRTVILRRPSCRPGCAASRREVENLRHMASDRRADQQHLG